MTRLYAEIETRSASFTRVDRTPAHADFSTGKILQNILIQGGSSFVLPSSSFNVPVSCQIFRRIYNLRTPNSYNKRDERGWNILNCIIFIFERIFGERFRNLAITVRPFPFIINMFSSNYF